MKYNAEEVVLYHENRLALLAVLYLTPVWIPSDAVTDFFKTSVTSPSTNGPFSETAAADFHTEAEYQSLALLRRPGKSEQCT